MEDSMFRANILRKAAAVAVLGASLGIAGCAGFGTYAYARIGPPAPRYESYSPRAGYVWTDGYYGYNGRSYYWVSGRYVRPPYRGARWVAPQWRQDRRGWFMVQGHWGR
jgi:hypothetical protein